MVKHTQDLLCTKVWSCCLGKSCSLSDLTRKIYGNNYSKNEIQVYKTVNNLVKNNVIFPVINGGICYKTNVDLLIGSEDVNHLLSLVDVDKLMGCLVKNNLVVQLGNNKFKLNKEGLK